ncbi:unnamed protein product [Amoebophrya sp. A25]|nr:unnamed protein product [Amoebophrya sp. A25]|eukprot:GSA25T00018492001.1
MQKLSSSSEAPPLPVAAYVPLLIILAFVFGPWSDTLEIPKAKPFYRVECLAPFESLCSRSRASVYELLADQELYERGEQMPLLDAFKRYVPIVVERPFQAPRNTNEAKAWIDVFRVEVLEAFLQKLLSFYKKDMQDSMTYANSLAHAYLSGDLVDCCERRRPREIPPTESFRAFGLSPFQNCHEHVCPVRYWWKHCNDTDIGADPKKPAKEGADGDGRQEIIYNEETEKWETRDAIRDPPAGSESHDHGPQVEPVPKLDQRLRPTRAEGEQDAPSGRLFIVPQSFYADSETVADAARLARGAPTLGNSYNGDRCLPTGIQLLDEYFYTDDELTNSTFPDSGAQGRLRKPQPLQQWSLKLEETLLEWDKLAQDLAPSTSATQRFREITGEYFGPEQFGPLNDRRTTRQLRKIAEVVGNRAATLEEFSSNSSTSTGGSGSATSSGDTKKIPETVSKALMENLLKTIADDDDLLGTPENAKDTFPVASGSRAYTLRKENKTSNASNVTVKVDPDSRFVSRVVEPAGFDEHGFPQVTIREFPVVPSADGTGFVPEHDPDGGEFWAIVPDEDNNTEGSNKEGATATRLNSSSSSLKTSSKTSGEVEDGGGTGSRALATTSLYGDEVLEKESRTGIFTCGEDEVVEPLRWTKQRRHHCFDFLWNP